MIVSPVTIPKEFVLGKLKLDVGKLPPSYKGEELRGTPKKVVTDVKVNEEGKVELTTESLDVQSAEKPPMHSLEWTDWVLAHLDEDEKIKGNPTTDGLRRIFEQVLNCEVTEALSRVVESPTPQNEKRATVTFHLGFVLKDEGVPLELKKKHVEGSADVYWGNCDKVYRNHPVAVAETRAEGRALRRALKLRKVVAAEEIADEIEDHVDKDNATKITNNQLNFIDVIAKRINVNVVKLLDQLAIKRANSYNIEHTDAVTVIQQLGEYQSKNTVPSELEGYDANWK
jgi:hypothetical protein